MANKFRYSDCVPLSPFACSYPNFLKILKWQNLKIWHFISVFQPKENGRCKENCKIISLISFILSKKLLQSNIKILLFTFYTTLFFMPEHFLQHHTKCISNNNFYYYWLIFSSIFKGNGLFFCIYIFPALLLSNFWTHWLISINLNTGKKKF